MKQILIIGNENLDSYKKDVAKLEQDKTGNLCFIAHSFISDLADETSEYILLTDGKKYSQDVLSYIDDAEEYGKNLKEIHISTLGEAIKHCDDIIQEHSNCDECTIAHMQLKHWLIELQILKTKLGN